MNIVIINGFDTYESRVMLLREFWIQKGNNVTVVTSDYRHVQKCKRTDAPEGFVMLKTKPYRKNISPGRIFSHIRFAKSVRKWLKKQDETIDVIWVLIPPNSLAKQVIKWKEAHETTKIVVDIIDVWPETMPFRGLEKLPFVRYWRNIRDKSIADADLVVTECKLFQDVIRSKVEPNKLRNLYFAKQSSDLYELRKRAKENEEKTAESDSNAIGLCYLGSINNIVDIDVIGNIIRQLNAQRPVELHIIGDGERREELIEKASACGAKVFYHGSVYESPEKAEILSKCDLGLNVMKDSVYVGLTMKSMDYFAAGLPMINNIKGDTWDIVKENGFGVNYPFEPEQIIRICSDANVGEKMNRYYKDNFSETAFFTSLETILLKD